MFRLSKEEMDKLVTICHRFKSLKHSSSKPYAFTEQGIAMLSSVLRSKKAIQVNISIMQIFVKLRKLTISYKEIVEKINELEKKYDR